jgi:hypothetical protein
MSAIPICEPSWVIRLNREKYKFVRKKENVFKEPNLEKLTWICHHILV